MVYLSNDMVNLKEFFNPPLHVFQLELSIYWQHLSMAFMIESFVVDQHRLSLAMECDQTLSNHFLGVIEAATCLPPIY